MGDRHIAAKFVVEKTRPGSSRTGRLMATSEDHSTKAACMNGIRSTKEIAAGAEVDDQTADGGQLHRRGCPRHPPLEPGRPAGPTS